MRIFKNGHFISLDESDHVYSVLGVDQGRIAYLGDEVPPQYNQEDTTDLKGGSVIPAFGDTHIHFSSPCRS